MDPTSASPSGTSRLDVLREAQAVRRQTFRTAAQLLKRNTPLIIVAECCAKLQPHNLDDVVEERSSSGLCGYPPCSRKTWAHARSTTERGGGRSGRLFKVSTSSSHQMLSMKELEPFCSEECWTALDSLKAQMPCQFAEHLHVPPPHRPIQSQTYAPRPASFSEKRVDLRVNSSGATRMSEQRTNGSASMPLPATVNMHAMDLKVMERGMDGMELASPKINNASNTTAVFPKAGDVSAAMEIEGYQTKFQIRLRNSDQQQTKPKSAHVHFASPAAVDSAMEDDKGEESIDLELAMQRQQHEDLEIDNPEVENNSEDSLLEPDGEDDAESFNFLDLSTAKQDLQQAFESFSAFQTLWDAWTQWTTWRTRAFLRGEPYAEPPELDTSKENIDEGKENTLDNMAVVVASNLSANNDEDASREAGELVTLGNTFEERRRYLCGALSRNVSIVVSSMHSKLVPNNHAAGVTSAATGGGFSTQLPTNAALQQDVQAFARTLDVTRAMPPLLTPQWRLATAVAVACVLQMKSDGGGGAEHMRAVQEVTVDLGLNADEFMILKETVEEGLG